MKKPILIALLCIFYAYSYCQIPAIKFDHIAIKEGLPEGQVRVVHQDAEGYMWIATQNGLVRYDGYDYKIYKLGSAQQNEMTNTSVISIFEDHDKAMWVSTVQNGLFRYARETDAFQQFKYPQNHILLKVWTEDKNEGLWCTYTSSHQSGASIARFDKITGHFELFKFDGKGANPLKGTDIEQIYQTQDGCIWLATNNGLYERKSGGKGFKNYFTTSDTSRTRGFNPIYEAPSEPGVLWANTFHGANIDLKLTRFDYRNYSLKNYSPGKNEGEMTNADISSIYEDKKKQLWLAIKGGISRLDRKTGRFTNFISADTEKNDFSDLIETSKGNFWLTNRHGLAYFDSAEGKFKFYRQKDDAPYVEQKILDNAGQLWVASYGVYKTNYLKSAFRIIKNVPGKATSYLGSESIVTTADSGNYWVFNGSSLYKWQSSGTEFKEILRANIKNCLSLCQGDHGIVYLASPNGLTSFNTATKKEVPVFSSVQDRAFIKESGINVIYRDRKGIIWLGTGGHGLASLDPRTQKLTKYPFKLGNNTVGAVDDGKLDDRFVLSIYEDRDNNLWVGTNLGGLNRLDRSSGRFHSYLTKDNPALYCVNYIREDHLGRVWIGTYLNGMFQFDKRSGKVVRVINENTGLLHNSVMQIDEDQTGHLLVLTERGITRYEPETGKFQNFKVQTILPGEDIAGNYHLGQSTMSASKLVVFALKEGLVAYNPLALAANSVVPLVHITGITYSDPLSDHSSNTVIPYKINTVYLTHNQKNIAFDYIGLHFDDPTQNRYAYKLEGYDKSWVQAGIVRKAVYTNLEPGRYTFHVRASNADGVWNNTGASVTVVIDTALWMRWWAWMMYILLFGGAFYGIVTYRSLALKRENFILEEKINQRTQELSTANQELSEQQEEITAQRDQLSVTVAELKTAQAQLVQSEKLASLGELTAGIAHEIQNPLNFVNNFSEVNHEMLEEMKEELDKNNLDEVKAIANDVIENSKKISMHGKRADSIVKGMLQHSQSGSGKKEPTAINALAHEYMRLAYHGLRAKDKSFTAVMTTNFDENISKVNLIPQDIGRVLLNLFNNAFYAVNQKQKTAGADYEPEVSVSTSSENGRVIISVKDNGVGIPDEIKNKIMQPFFTTKPTGEGTGLGLSLTYDMVVKGHSGKIEVITKEGEFTEIVVTLPV